MDAEASPPEELRGERTLTEDQRLRFQAACAQATDARAEARHLIRELTIARRLLRFFFDGPPPARVAATAEIHPVSAALLTGEMRFHLDACRKQEQHTTITGWAFCPVAAWDGHAASVVLVLRRDAAAYSVATSHSPRPDVAAHFSSQPAEVSGGARGLEGSGFACVVLNDSLPAGVDLEIALRLECAGLACERSTGQMLRL